MRPGQRQLVESLLPTIEITLDHGTEPLDPAALFPADISDIWIEIGFGGGEHLAWQAERNRDIGFIGCEPFINGVVKCLGQIDANGLDNIRLFRDDARLLLDLMPERSVGRAFVLFPDPWPKVRHHKRRMVSEPVISRLAEILRDGAELRIATDDPGYLEWILLHMRKNPDFEWCARGPADWRDRPSDWPKTRYEEKADRAGRTSAFLRYIRRRRADSG